LQPFALASAVEVLEELELESFELPLREIRIAATTPSAITAKTARMIQRRSGCCCSTARNPNTHAYDLRVAASPLLTPLAAAVLHVGDPERILQVDCGDGEGALFLAREFPSARVRGIDRDGDAVREATNRVGLDPEGRVAFKQGGPRSLPFPDGYFDLLAAVDARPRPAEAARVLRPGGFLALASTRSAETSAGLRGRLFSRGLVRLGFEPIWAQPAGDGSFLVARLRGANPTAPSL
jgi:SAM-dependent methyltransferase